LVTHRSPAISGTTDDYALTARPGKNVGKQLVLVEDAPLALGPFATRQRL
jgi:hypothetical protein